MEKKIRPLSPHLLVYKPQLTSIFSIFHRISGGLLFFTIFFIIILFYCIYFLSMFFYTYFIFNFFIPFFNVFFTFLFFFLFFIFFFHTANGLRHISWDFCFYLEIKNVYLTGSIVFFISLIGFFFLILI